MSAAVGGDDMEGRGGEGIEGFVIVYFRICR